MNNVQRKFLIMRTMITITIIMNRSTAILMRIIIKIPKCYKLDNLFKPNEIYSSQLIVKILILVLNHIENLILNHLYFK
jgi:hypothetical protein